MHFITWDCKLARANRWRMFVEAIVKSHNYADCIYILTSHGKQISTTLIVLVTTLAYQMKFG